MEPMTHLPPFMEVAETLLHDLIAESGTNASDEAAAQSLLNELLAEIAPAMTNSSAQVDSSDLEALMAQLGIDLNQPELSVDHLLQEWLHEQDNPALVAMLSSHLESAFAIVERLNTRPLAKQMRNLIRPVELQLVATSLGVEDLRRALEQPQIAQQRPSSNWRTQMRRFLLHEFNFINQFIR